MKKRIIFLFILCFSISGLIAQTPVTLKKVMLLKMPKEVGDDNAGANGASVVWHPGQKKYYAVMAGNQNFPLAIFNSTGKRLSSDDLQAMIDVRGLWYHPLKKEICGNAYSDYGWFHYNIAPKGVVQSKEVDIAEMRQPGSHSVGTYNEMSNSVIFLDGNQLASYSNKGVLFEKKIIRFGTIIEDDIGEEISADPDTPEEYNYTNIIYTGKPGKEIGLLNLDKRQFELYNFKNGFLTAILKLPADTELYPMFNMSFTNDTYWLFNKKTREWTGYK